MSSPGRTSRIAIPGGCSVSSPAGRSSPGPSGSCAGSCSPRSGSVGGRVSRGRGTAGRRSRSRSFRFGRAYFRGGCARLMLSYSHSCSHGEQQHKHERIPENVFTLRHKIHRDSWRSNPIVTSASAAFQRHWLFFDCLDTWSQSRRRRLTPWGGSGRTPQSVGSALGSISGTTPPTLGSNSDTGDRASQDKSRLGHAAASLCILRDSLTSARYNPASRTGRCLCRRLYKEELEVIS